MQNTRAFLGSMFLAIVSLGACYLVSTVGGMLIVLFHVLVIRLVVVSPLLVVSVRRLLGVGSL